MYERRADIFEIIKKLSKQKKQIIDTEFFSEKHKHIIDSSEFYFQKARDVLEQLKNYWSLSGPLNDTVKDENVPLAFPYQELDSYWKEKGKVTPAKFIELLKKEQPELIPLYELIGKFLSYVDRRSWNRQNFNEYEDKRYIAESGVFYGDLVSHFLQYAINDFKLLPEKSNNIFNRVIEYLQEPQLKFNILSPRHQELISSYFLIVNFTGEEFHRRLLQYFEKFELSTVNAENRTCLYSAILYDFEIKKLWDKEGKTDTVEEEPEISEPETGVIKTSLDNDGAFAPKDLLDIENDVRSFALVLASKEVKPPLAVALFGKWGSGKSFFMEQLSKRVDELSINQGFLEEGETTPTQDEEKEPDAFCKGIAQIKFNAWSYMDANLLAGLVSSIFEKLDEYITDRTKSGVAKLKVQEKLGERLKALRALIETEEGKKIRLELLKKGYQQESLKLEKNIVQNLGKEILEISNADDELQKTFEDLSLNEEQFGKNFTINGVKLISEYKYWANFIKNLKKAPQLFTFLLFAIIGIGIAYSLVHFTQINISFLYSSPLVLPLIKALSWWKGKQINIKKYVNQFNTVIEANSDIKDKVTQLESKIKFANEQKEKAQEKIQELEIKIQNIQTDLTENITEAAIHNFIGDRAKHKDYKEYLGIVSTIRKDFETLSELFSESNEDNKEADNKDELQKRKDKILNEERGFIKEQFKDGKKLDRIILYIDDLDRCSDEKVLEIIQAVHLIMAFPLFNVVVGVDRRCVENALIYKNLLQYTQYASLDEIEEAGIHVITPDEYLEKIFQIPFQLDDPSEGSIKGMVNSLLKNQIEKEVVEDKKPQPEVLPEKEKPSIDDIIAEFVDEEKTDEAINEELGIPAEEIVEKPQQRTITPKDLELSKTELSLLKEMAWLVGSIPRTIKRFINIYRIIRAHQNLNLDDNKKREEYLVIMFILAIHIGQYKKFAPKLMELIVDSEINLKEAFDKFNTSLIVQKDIAKIKNAVFEIRHKLETTEAIKELLQFNGTKFSKHIQLVGRFSFGSVENGINND